MTKQPNLFSFATSELSQDAFICWLIDWANPEYKDLSAPMKECAISFLQKCYELHSKKFPEVIEKLEIKRQYKRMDAVVVIKGENTECAILIEDKILSKQGKTQLSKYKEQLSKEYECILPIYYKIIEQSGIETIQNDGYKIIAREDMLGLLDVAKNKGAANPILLDYICHMKNIDDMIHSYERRPRESWNDYSWIGFYSFLLKELEKAEWDYVPNRGGGFYGLWWCEKKIDGGKIYLQLEQDKLCYKLEKEDPKDGDELKVRFSESMRLLAQENALETVKIRKAATMTGAKSEYLKWDENGLLNIEATLKDLRKAEGLLKAIKI